VEYDITGKKARVWLDKETWEIDLVPFVEWAEKYHPKEFEKGKTSINPKSAEFAEVIQEWIRWR
jgi:hypothetical protein